MTQTAYLASHVKRARRTNAELDRIDDHIWFACNAEHPVTLRGVYYRVVSAGAVEKTEAGYQLVGRQLLKLRRNGEIPYSWITDGTRFTLKPNTWTDLDAMLDDAAASYRRALWHNQPVEVMILSEKDAITGAILPITEKWDVPLGIVRGYSSETFAHSVAAGVSASDKPVFLYQLGDHDPSGVDAWNSFTERIRGFAPDADVTFERLAVTEAQINTMNLPTRPTKTTNSRSRNFTGESVEVDAIPASVLRRLVEDAIVGHVDSEQLRLMGIAEQSERDIFSAMVDFRESL